jgi:DNA-binding NarL/FixJ family response regulator
MSVLSAGQATSIRVLVADEQASFRRGLLDLLQTELDIEVVAEAGDVPKAVELASQLKPDIVLLDFALCQKPEVTGSSGTRQSLALLPILMMIGNSDRAHILGSFYLGAKGVVLKASAPHLLVRSIRSAVTSDYWLESHTAAILIDALREMLPQKAATASRDGFGLTPRELEIVEGVAQGQSNKQIAIGFSICERTVKHHLTSIFDKLGVSSRLALALFARENNIHRGNMDSYVSR